MKKLFNMLMILIVLAALGGGGYAAFLYGSPYVHYRLFENSAEAIIKYPIKDLDDFKTKLLASAKDNGVDLLEKEDASDAYGLFGFNTSENNYTVQLNWAVDVNFFGYFPKTYKYELEYSR
jgi:hypothetical protein